VQLRRRWPHRELLAFDLETTGVDPWVDVPVSFALVTMRRGRPRRSVVALVDPGRPIPAGATAVHGVTDERVASEGLSLTDALAVIADALVDASARGVPVVGMKLDFDLTIVDTQLRLATGRGLEERGFRAPVLDALVLDRQADRYRRGPRTLSDLCRHYGVGLAHAHDAAADATAAAAVVRALARRYRWLGRRSAEELHADQIRWHAEWTASYDAWRRRSGLDPLTPGVGWPVASPAVVVMEAAAG
jgi:DNA polymerase-3 subunit epsilon